MRADPDVSLSRKREGLSSAQHYSNLTCVSVPANHD